MKEDYHIDMSGRIYKKKTVGIACVGAQTKTNNGCALKGNLIKFIQKNLCIGSVYEEYAKLYAISIFLLVKGKVKDISTLIICNDEDFNYVKEYLLFLIQQEGDSLLEIISIGDLKKKLGRNVKSLADNFAKCYRKRALNKNKWENGKKLDVINIDYKTIEEYWKKLEKIK